MKYNSIACVADSTPKAKDAHKELSALYKFNDNPATAELIIVLGGDGFMLHSLHEYMDYGVPVFGMNCGTVGFLMNEYNTQTLHERLEKAKAAILHPLHMTATTKDGSQHHALAINEVSMLRMSKQAAVLDIAVDGRTRLAELICDGVLVSTPAGSTAYNFSVYGPIIPLRSEILALTPISPFRPRRWRGALLDHKAVVKIDVTSSEKRPVSAVADFTEVRDVISVEIREERNKSITLLFDEGHSLEERIINEQFTH